MGVSFLMNRHTCLDAKKKRCPMIGRAALVVVCVVLLDCDLFPVSDVNTLLGRFACKLAAIEVIPFTI